MANRIVYVVCAEGEEQLADQLAGPLKKAGYEVAHNGTVTVGESLVDEAQRALAHGAAIVLSATAKAVGSAWAHQSVNAAQGDGSIRVFVVQRERQAYVAQLAMN